MLQPAQLRLVHHNTKSQWCFGNLVLYLLSQASSVTMDFGALTLQ